MAARADGAKKDLAAAGTTFDAGGGGGLTGGHHDGVDFGGLGSMSTGPGGGGHDHALVFDAPAPPDGGLDHAFAFDASPGPGGGREGLKSPDGRLARPLLGAEHVGGADPAPAARRGAPHGHGPERHPLRAVAAADFQVQRAGRDRDRGGMMRRPALLLALLLVGAMAIINDGGEPGAPWLELGALLAWLTGCAMLFLSLQ